MPRLMTSEVKAAVVKQVAPIAAEAQADAFTLEEANASAGSPEAWSLGDETVEPAPAGTPERPTRPALPKVLVATAAVLACAVVAALLLMATSRSRQAATKGEDETSANSSDLRDGSGRLSEATPSGSAEVPAAAPAKPPTAGTRTSPPAADKPAPSPTKAAAPTVEAEAAPPADYDANMRAGRAALQGGDLAAALSAFQAAAALKPLSVEAVTGIARAQAGSDDTAAAIKSFERAVAIRNDYLPAWTGLAHLRAASGNTSGAVDAYRRILELNPNPRDEKSAREALEDLGVTEP